MTKKIILKQICNRFVKLEGGTTYRYVNLECTNRFNRIVGHLRRWRCISVGFDGFRGLCSDGIWIESACTPERTDNVVSRIKIKLFKINPWSYRKIRYGRQSAETAFLRQELREKRKHDTSGKMGGEREHWTSTAGLYSLRSQTMLQYV